MEVIEEGRRRREEKGNIKGEREEYSGYFPIPSGL